MSTPLCQHGFSPGRCPYGCKSTADAKLPSNSLGPIPPGIGTEQIPQWEDKEPPEPETDKLKCAICGQEVTEGTVYKGRPICNDCREGMKGEK